MIKIVGYVEYEGRTIGLLDDNYFYRWIDRKNLQRLKIKRKKNYAQAWYALNRERVLAKMRQKRLEKLGGI